MSNGSLHPSNHLKGEKSPYLRQHAGNPVDWYPWSVEALGTARKDDKPLLISIGYSSCHWCHVMERESFEDAETAGIMNENFVNIKVDREERPDLDSLYIKAIQAMTGHAGWPLTIFATPDGAPFYGGSYFPPEDRYGMPAFKKVLLAASLAYRKNRKKIEAVTNDIEKMLGGRNIISAVELNSGVLDAAFDAARLFFDPVNGGFGRGTKFPHAMFLKFLLKYHRRTNNAEALAMVRKSLYSMAAGGIYDHVGGGFHRYSVDDRWDIPHFEKMLYDNALLAEAYTLGYEVTGSMFFRDVALETLGYMLRDLKAEMGGFFSSQDADVDGEEGGYYLWEAQELGELLGEGEKRFTGLFPVSPEGNYEGKNMLRLDRTLKDIGQIGEDIKKMRSRLFEARRKRKAPEVDRKVITAWNGLAISSLAGAYKAFKRRDFIDEAKRCARFLLSSVRDENGRLLRYFLDGRANVKGVLEDYALLALGLLSIHEATGEDEWLEEAKRLAEKMVELFYDDAEEFFYDTGRDQEKLFVRERDLYDNDVPSGNSAAAALLFRLSEITGNRRWLELSEKILRTVEGISDEPISYGNFLWVLESFMEERGERPH